MNTIVGGVEPTNTACSNCAVCNQTEVGMNCLDPTEYPRCPRTDQGGCITMAC